MQSVKSYMGADVFADGKNIGKITDVSVDVKNKCIKGISCLSNTGIIRTKFFVPNAGIQKLDKDATVVDKKCIVYKKDYSEEYSVSGFGISKNANYGYNSLGDIFINPESGKIQSISLKKSFIDDLILGRETVDISDVTLTEHGKIIFNENRR